MGWSNQATPGIGSRPRPRQIQILERRQKSNFGRNSVYSRNVLPVVNCDERMSLDMIHPSSKKQHAISSGVMGVLQQGGLPLDGTSGVGADELGSGLAGTGPSLVPGLGAL